MSKLCRLQQKYHAMPISVRASLLFTICGVLQKGISFIVVPIYTRIMSVEAYGQYSVFLSWYQLIMVFTTLKMWNYLINNGMTKYGKDKNNFVSSLQGLSTCITLVWFVIYLFFIDVWERYTGLTFPMMLLMFIELLVMPSYEYYCAAKRYDYDAGRVVQLTVLLSVLIPVVSIPLILCTQEKGMAAIGGRVIVSILIYGVVFVHVFRKGKKHYSKEYWSYALHFNLPLIPHFLSTMVLQQSDRIMIERMCGQTDAAIYSVAYQVALALQIVNTAILNSFIPYTYRAIKEGKSEKVGKLSVPLIVAVGAINIFAALVAPEIISIMAPEAYMTAVYVIPPVAMSNLFMFLFNLFVNVEYYWGETKMVAVASIISAVVNVVLNYIFIPKFGFVAAGYTTLVCYILFGICHYTFMRRVCHKYMDGYKVYDAKLIFGLVSVFTVGAMAILAIYDYVWARYGILVVGIIVVLVKRKQILGTLVKLKK